jgi:precorrin-3B synthase
MVEWFLATGGADSGRMARHLQITRLPQAWHTAEPSVAADTPQPGEVREGTLYGVPFGQTDADVLERLITNTGASHLRVTPWRMLLAEGAVVTDVPGLLTQPDPLLNIAACPGAPGCAQASVATRDLARALAQHTRGSLHVSGCDKGCARRTKADTTLVGKNGRFDLVKDGRPGDTPHQSGLSVAEVLTKMARADAL